ncbi:hypothetical protein CWB72_13715 [Pseudoalteromonas phenolica]|uniref:TMEM175 family protein n=1 Tax=Pseudoalteromonas phenolica TaxID=161398 RepID=UPI00110AEA4A|nr:TMEM175 family protein [Pseudoalteromonas phenolica]TMN88173.1 hypothetical protein CWB72_13715 [Pseudoalteromonas phenolica]
MVSKSRIEALSDAIFGLALTFLVVKMEIPKSYAEFESMSHGFIGFFITFLMLFIIWNNQARLLSSIDKVDAPLKILLACFLFTILFFVFPLKYMFTLALETFFPFYQSAIKMEETLTLSQISQLIHIFSSTLMTIFGLLMLMNIYIYKNREKLILTVSKISIKREIFTDLAIVLVALLSHTMVYLLSPNLLYLTGVIYLLILPTRWLLGKRYKEESTLSLNPAI